MKSNSGNEINKFDKLKSHKRQINTFVLHFKPNFHIFTFKEDKNELNI